MGKTFIITINFSKILKLEKRTLYTMLVDESEMTIVYELTEWIRWIFSLKSCCYLTHQNTVIHELEDIRILSLLKDFEINTCDSLHCIHKKTHKSVLDRLGFFTSWKGLQVPTSFLEKIIKIQQKFDLIECSSFNSAVSSNVKSSLNAGSKNKEPKSLPSNNPVDLQLPCLHHENHTKPIPNNHEMLFDNKSENEVQGVYVTVEKPKEFKSNEDVKILSSNIHNPKIHEENKSGEEISPVNYKTNSVNVSPAKRIKTDDNEDFIINSGSKTKFNGTRRVKNYIKPFTLGDVLKNLRDEHKEMHDNAEMGQTVQENESPAAYGTGIKEKQLINQDLHVSFDDYTNVPTRKRKRIRKHKSKKVKSEVMSSGVLTCPVPYENIALNYSSNVSCEGKSNHIRFSSDDENDGEKVIEYTEGKDCIVNDSSIGNAFKKFDFSRKLEPEIKEEKQIFSDAGLHTEDVSGEADCELAVNSLMNTNDNLLVLDPDVSNDDATKCGPVFQISSENKVHELNTLMSLKKKYPDPVIIERFR